MQIKSVAVGAGGLPVAQLALNLGLDYAGSDWQLRDPDAGADWEHNVPADQLWWDTYVVQAGSLAEARSLLPLFRSEGRAKRFVLVIKGFFPAEEQPAWTPRSLQYKAGTAALTIPGLGMAVTVTGGKWVNVHSAALAALGCATPVPVSAVLGGLRAGFTDTTDREWLAGDARGSFMTNALLQPDADDIFPVDVVIGPADLAPRLEAQPAEHPGRVIPPVWTPSGSALPPVDTAVVSPMGFIPYADKPAKSLQPADLRPGGTLGETELASLRPHRYLSIDGAHFAGRDWDLARHVSQLAVAGVPVLARELSAQAQSLLGKELVDCIAAFDAGDPPVVRESKSIELRRTALDQFGPKAVWNRVLGELGRPTLPLPSVSVVLATRRPEKLASALKQLARQSWKSMEVVVVLHGFAADLPEVRSAVAAYPGELQLQSVPADMVFGEVLNAGVAAASGDLVCKMDDDDWYGPHHLRDLVHAKEFSGATLVGAQVEFVYLESVDITTRRPPLGEQFSDHVAGGTMMLGRDELRQLGGWRPVHRAVDRCLLQAVQAAGGLIYRSHGQNYMMHRHSDADSHGGHTWNPGDSIFLQSVAEQWDGFRPPPQLGLAGDGNAHHRSRTMRSHFAGQPAMDSRPISTYNPLIEEANR